MDTLAGLAAAFLAALTPSASAPESLLRLAHPVAMVHVQVLRVGGAPVDRRTRTCSARGSNRQTNRVEKQLAPVACEQPPRSTVILTFQGGLLGGGR